MLPSPCDASPGTELALVHGRLVQRDGLQEYVAGAAIELALGRRPHVLLEDAGGDGTAGRWPDQPSGSSALPNAVYEPSDTPSTLRVVAIRDVVAGEPITAWRSAGVRLVRSPPASRPRAPVFRVLPYMVPGGPITVRALGSAVAQNPAARLFVNARDLAAPDQQASDLRALGFEEVRGSADRLLVRMPLPDRRWFRAQLGLHGASLVLHLTNAILGMVVLMAYGSAKVPLTVTRLVYENQTAGANTTGLDACAPVYGTYRARTRPRCLVDFHGLAILTISEAVTAVWQVFYLIELAVPDLPFQKNRVHGLRWIEYALTATAISLGQLTGTGDREVSTVLVAGLSLIAMQGLGWLTEAERAAGRKGRALACFALGSLLQGAVFAALFVRIAFGQQENPPNTSSSDDWTVTAVLYTITYLQFPIIAIVQVFSRARYEWIELTYAVASVATKTSVFWLIFSTVVRIQEEYGTVRRSGVDWYAVRTAAQVFAAAGIVAVGTVLGFAGARVL